MKRLNELITGDIYRTQGQTNWRRVERIEGEYMWVKRMEWHHGMTYWTGPVRVKRTKIFVEVRE